MNFSLIVRRLGTKLLRTEQAVDAAVAGTAELIAEAYQAQAAANYHGSLAQPAQSDLIEALSHLNAARDKVLSAHAKMAEMQAAAGDRTVLSGYQFKENRGGAAVTMADEQANAA